MHISMGKRKHRTNSVRGFEDALTSMFFGTLQYMPKRYVVEFFKRICTRLYLADLELDGLESDCSYEIEFWPNIAQSGRIEPDVVVKFQQSNGAVKAVLVIECKWDADESGNVRGEPQLFSQWRAISESPDGSSNVVHIYLVKDRQRGKAALDRNKNYASEHGRGWGGRLVVLTWQDVLETIQEKSEDGADAKEVVKKWKTDIAAMFERAGVRSFRGFESLEGSAKIINEVASPVFWHFLFGWSSFDTIIVPASGTVFFTNSQQ